MVEVESARTRLLTNWTGFLSRLESGDTIPYIDRVRCFHELTHAHMACSGAVFELIGVNGGRTMQQDGALQRLFRDMLAMRNHPAANIELSTGLYAQAKLGLPPPPFVPTQRFVL
jgi:3-hydroxy-9,10-secoandrosta-1,3,5(10)-triene-9,17-dione monooxygenase